MIRRIRMIMTRRTRIIMTRRKRIIMTSRTRLPCQVKVEGGMVLLIHDVVDAANIFHMIMMMVFMMIIVNDYDS